MNLPDQIMQVAIDTFTLPPHHSTNCYIIGGDRTALLIDPIYSRANPLDLYLQENNIGSIQHAAVTHPHSDHYGGIDALLKTYGGNLVCHREVTEQSLIGGLAPDLIHRLDGKETIFIGGYTVEVLHTPGHSPAHLCFYIPQERILFSGDTILGRGTAIITPPEGDMAAYLRTLAKLAEMDIRMICPAHGPIIDRRAAERIRWYIAHREMREARILEALQKGLSQPGPITRSIYDETDFKMHGRDLQPRGERTVYAHLLKLEKEGAVVTEDRSDGRHYFPA